MADLDPLSGPVIRTAAPAPLQGQTTSYGRGLLGSFMSSAAGGVTASAVARNFPGGADNTFIPYDDAVQQFKDQGFDAAVLPKGGAYQSSLDAIKTQQTLVRNASDAANRSTAAGGVGEFVAGLAGGFTDPIFMALGPLGKLARPAGTVARILTGGAEGGAVMGGYTAAQKAIGTAPGDADINAYSIVRQTGVGMVIGGAAKGAFGQRLQTDTVAKLERSDVVAKKLGISPNDVVSPAGAVGVHQIMPATAKLVMGKDFDVATLHDPEVNKEVSEKLLRENNKLFPGDAEAQVIAYNAGAAKAMDWVRAGRDDSVLPDETKKYVAHYREIRDQNPVARAASLPPEVRDNAMKTAVASIAEDSDVNVDPVIDNGLAERDAEVAAKPKPNPLVVARRMEDGSVRYGKPGDMHFDLYDEDELEQRSVGSVSIDQKDMGFAEPGGPFMSREEAARYVNSPDNKLESQRYNMQQAGETVPAFGKRVPPLIEALPKSGSANINERLSSEMLQQVNAKAEAAKPVQTNELEEMNKQAADAAKYAAHAHEMAFGETPEGQKSALDTVLAKADEDNKQDEELAKGIDAAVRCGAIRGFA